MSKPKLLDLFCKAGGAAWGYADAGFDVVGVDIEPQKHFPYEFHQADAMEVLQDTAFLQQFDVIHASPPCQEYSASRHLRKVTAPHIAPKAMLIEQVRAHLVAIGKPWIIENVEGAPLPDALELCGSMFGLPMRRHRWFSSSHYLYAPGPCRHTPEIICLVGNKVRGYGTLRTQHWYACKDGQQRQRESYLTHAEGSAAMGIDWMTIAEMCQAIPPAYTRWIGSQLLDILAYKEAV